MLLENSLLLTRVPQEEPLWTTIESDQIGSDNIRVSIEGKYKNLGQLLIFMFEGFHQGKRVCDLENRILLVEN